VFHGNVNKSFQGPPDAHVTRESRMKAVGRMRAARESRMKDVGRMRAARVGISTKITH
jgi:hypothetical protein